MIKIFIAIVFVLVIIMGAYVCDMAFNNSEGSNKILYSEKACDYTVPSGYHMVKNADNEYAIAVDMLGDYYLYTGNYGVTTMFSSITKPATFKDSCYAKGYLKKYMEQNEKRFTPAEK